MSNYEPSPHIYAHRARWLIETYQTKHEAHRDTFVHGLDKLRQLSRLPAITPDQPVCIIGAGVTGLYAAMMLSDLEIPFKVLEATHPNDVRKVGGRLWTRQIGTGDGNYFDVGAMRFPQTPFMKRTFRLIDDLNLQKLPYYMEASPNAFTYYNGHRHRNSENYASEDPYRVADYVDPHKLLVNAPLTAEEVKRAIDEALGAPGSTPSPRPRPLDAFTRQQFNLDSALKELHEKFDDYSMRTWLHSYYPSWTSAVINWCETVDKSSGWYDRALVETVLEYLAFSWPQCPTKNFNNEWYCLEGGSSSLPVAMMSHLPKGSLAFGQIVTAIAEVKGAHGPESHMEVTVNTTEAPQKYSAVISTVPLPRLSLMDLTQCNIIGANYAQWSAMRELQYGPAIKIGMRFTEAWWYTKLGIQGGSSYSDLPLRTVVYPSYPSVTNPSSVLISSYCWTQDAERLGALMKGDGTARDELIELVLRDLSAIHGIDVTEFYDRRAGDSVYFAWNWVADVYAMGAYAFFGPQQFNDQIYAHMCRPAAHGKLMFAGEATSSCHAWVAGALDSAWRAVSQLLITFYPKDRRRNQTFLEKYGKSEYWYDASKAATSGISLLERHVQIALHHSLKSGWIGD